MAKFTSNKTINSEWRWNRFFGPAGSSFTIADAMYDEFIVDWAKQISDGDIVITETPTTGNIQMASLTVGDIVLTGTATGNFGGGGGAATVVQGTAPISVSTSSNTATVSLSASYSSSTHDHSGIYQPFGTYVSSVIGTAPISASGTTAVTLTLDQAGITAATAATNAEVLRTYVKNVTGSTIPKGSAVYISSATGDNALISLASATAEVTSSKTLGITASAISTDDFGYVIEDGYLSGIDTSTATAGQSIWLGDTPGSIVFGAPPAEPSHSVYLGVVARVQSNNGSILVKVQNGYELDELHNVSAGSPSDGDIIQYKTSSSLWTKSSIAGAGIAASTHTHAYQPEGTYVTGGQGTSPISVSGTTYLSVSHDATDGNHHVPATSTTNSGKFLKAGATAGSEAWANIATSDITSGNYVATVQGGTGVTSSASSGNAANTTISIGQAVATSSTPTFAGLTVNGLITGSIDSGTSNVINGIIVVRSTTASISTTTIPTSPTTANTTLLSWSSALKVNTTWWTSGSSITLPLPGMYSVTIALTAGSGTGYATAAYLFQGTTLRYHTEIQASANGQYDILNIAGMIYTTTANETIKVGIAASTTGKIINVTPKNGIMAVAYLGSF